MNFSFPCLYVLGANTDVGKTVLSTGLLRASEKCGSKSLYVKPMQTGSQEVWDHLFVRRMCGPSVNCQVLFTWEQAVSPHLAAQAENKFVSDEEVLAAMRGALHEFESAIAHTNHEAFAIIEGAGGVASPTATGELQCNVFRNFLQPVVVVGDGRLGGISSTVCAVESLLLRGFTVTGVVLFETGLSNAPAIERALGMKIPVWGGPALVKPTETLENWYAQHQAFFDEVYSEIRSFHAQVALREKELPQIAQKIFGGPQPNI